MVDALEEARFLWKLFDLNKSEGAGMEAYEDGQLVKKHGAVVPKLADFRVCVSPVVARRDVLADGSGNAKSSKRSRRAG